MTVFKNVFPVTSEIEKMAEWFCRTCSGFYYIYNLFVAYIIIYCIMHTLYIMYMHHIYCIMHTPIYNIYASYLLYHIPLSAYIISNVSHTPICMHHIYCITYPYLYVSYLLYHILLSACIISTNKITFQR